MSVPAPIIDFHTHAFPDDLAPRAVESLLEYVPHKRAFHNATMDGLLASMDSAGVDTSVALSIATKPSQVTAINDWCARNRCPRIVAFGSVHAAMENPAAEVDRCYSAGIRGIKLHPEYQDFYVDDRRMYPAYEAAQDWGLTVVFHAGKDPGPFTCDHALPPAFLRIRRDFPRLRMVLAHMGGWQIWEQVEEHLLDADVYFDTAAVMGLLPASAFARMARRHGVERVLFGTDSPWFEQRGVTEWVDGLDLTSSEKDRIFTLNARGILGL